MTFNNLTTDKKYGADFFHRIIEQAILEIGLMLNDVEMSVNLVGEGRIKALNKKYRGRNRVTDVLSFPLLEKVDVKSAKNAILSLGDIFICLPVAKKRAAHEGVVLDFKLAFLTVHGFLHLLGYDHEKSSAEKKMFELQDKILSKISF